MRYPIFSEAPRYWKVWAGSSKLEAQARTKAFQNPLIKDYTLNYDRIPNMNYKVCSLIKGLWKVWEPCKIWRRGMQAPRPWPWPAGLCHDNIQPLTIHVCMYVCQCMSMYVNVCQCMLMYVCMYACMYVCLCVCMYVCMCVCMYVNVCQCMYVCMCAYIYIYTYVS